MERVCVFVFIVIKESNDDCLYVIIIGSLKEGEIELCLYRLNSTLRILRYIQYTRGDFSFFSHDMYLYMLLLISMVHMFPSSLHDLNLREHCM